MKKFVTITVLATAFGLGMILVGAPEGDAGGGWLDARGANWNRPGVALPLAPKGTGQKPARCAGMLAKPESNEELALSSLGWSSLGITRSGSVSVVTGVLGFDGMCRPDELQLFAFVDGKFAGTLSPNLMYARQDGVLRKISFNASQAPIVEFLRYGPHDPMCCASFISTAEYEIVSENGHPVVTLKNATTRAAQ